MATEEAASLNSEQLLEEGKKHLAAGNAAEAAESFQEACAMLAEQYGQLDCELAEPYYLYGRSLLEVARIQNTVLGSGIPVPNEREDSSDEETAENGEAPDANEATATGDATGSSVSANGDSAVTSTVNDAPEDAPGSSTTNEDAPGPSTTNEDAPGPSTTNEDAPGSSTTNEDAPGPSTTNEDAPGPSTTNEDAPGSSTTNEDAPGPSTTNEDAPGPSTTNEDVPGPSTANETEEEESDLKLAWEILELARVICQKQSGEEYKLKLADVQLALAEVSLECDQTEQAIADLNTSLQIRELLLNAHDRRIAEVHFNLGLAHSLNKQPDQAIKHFTSSKDVLLKRKELLDQELGQTDLPEERRKNAEEEVSEINSLLPDIESKVSDTREMKRLMEERENQATAEVVQESGFPQVASDKKPVSDISHLVRKRAPDNGDGNPAKKARSENGCSSVTAEQ